MSKELTGKVAVVTGAGRNIGRAIALTLAEGGASVLVNARSNRAEAEAVAREVEAAGGKAIVHIGDVADAKSVQAMADAAVKQLGRIDILVNNAALRREKSFAEMDYAEWREILDVTLDGAFHCTKACLPSLRRADRGRSSISVASARTRARRTVPMSSPPRPASSASPARSRMILPLTASPSIAWFPG